VKKAGPRYRVPLRRRREGRTDYRQRLRLLASGKPRLVPRVSLNHVSVQVIEYSKGGDRVLASAHSKELEKFGWKGGTSNIPAAYLVGLLCGYRAVKAGVGECVLDLGGFTPTPGSRVFSALKGALDAGLSVPHGEVLPDEERISGKHISAHALSLKERDASEYGAKFSGYLKRGMPPEKLPEHFNEVRQEIVKQFQ